MNHRHAAAERLRMPACGTAEVPAPRRYGIGRLAQVVVAHAVRLS
jgi:hypothetical protein